MRHMSFILTKRQVLDRSKTVTRRMGSADAKPGDRRQPVEKQQGLKKGEHVVKIGPPIVFVDVRRESLGRLLDDLDYGRREVDREGFPEMSVQEFVDLFCAANRCGSRADVTRIEYRYEE